MSPKKSTRFIHLNVSKPIRPVRSRPRPACPEGLDAFHDPIAAGRTRHLERWYRRQTSGKSATYLVVAEYGVGVVHI
ncbi:MAG: hypothetical protein K2Y56_18810 [Methylobacterium sp.]|uniref:hypothetical protein n=1 Tax=Methylobacterium sp. TaxID=409 RepID=UPI0025DD3727|nr:hypothetical protein [Methylobacterium sp.]MBX9933543.1 hypothetical protein [Methylobacterium sp.]